MYSLLIFFFYLHNDQRHEKYPKNIQRAKKEGKIIIWHSCTFCHYKSDRRYNLKVHMQNCLNFVNDQCTQEAGTQTNSSSKKEKDHGIDRVGW